MGIYCPDCHFCGFGSGLVVNVGALVVSNGSFWGHWGLFALVIYFREVMLTSPPELDHCGEGGGGRGKKKVRDLVPRYLTFCNSDFTLQNFSDSVMHLILENFIDLFHLYKP